MKIIAGKGMKKLSNSLRIMELSLKNRQNCWFESSWAVLQNVIQMLSEKSAPTSFLVDNMHVMLSDTSLTKRWSVLHHATFLHPSLCYRPEYLLVGTVNKGIVEPFQIDTCGALGGVTHRFANGCHGYILALGYARPRVTRHIRGEFGGQPQILAQFL